MTIDNGDAEQYFEYFERTMRPHYTRAISNIIDKIGDQGKVLDIGCGVGVFGILLCDRTEYYNIFGLERSGLLVRIGEAISSRFSYARRVSFKTWQENVLPFPDREFDAVVSVLSLNRWGDCRTVFREIERVRKDKSLVYISDFRREIAFPPFMALAIRNRFSAGRGIAADLTNSFKSSYTTGELRSILAEADLGNWQVEKSGRFLNIASLSESLISS